MTLASGTPRRSFRHVRFHLGCSRSSAPIVTHFPYRPTDCVVRATGRLAGTGAEVGPFDISHTPETGPLASAS